MPVMKNQTIQLLAVSGSLRAASSNTALLAASASLAPAGVVITRYTGVGGLPHFNPDIEDELPPAVADWRARVGAADGLLIACPEYARGVPGAFKNALDWLVGGPEFVGKPVALFNASPRASHAQNALRTTLETMSGRIVDAACIAVPLLGSDLDAKAIAADPALMEPVRAAVAAFAQELARPSTRAGRDSAQ